MADEVQALPLAELRRRKSVKWRQHPSDVLPLPVAEMDFPIAEPIKTALSDLITRSDTGYLGPFPELFEAFSEFSFTTWDWRPDPSQMRFATDVGVATVEVLRALTNSGDRVILNAPVYDSMWRWVPEAKCEVLNVPLRENGMDYELDLEALEAAYKMGAKVHILCSPHNPVGILFDRATLVQVAALAKRYGVIVISDEIHAALTFPTNKFQPFLSASAEASEVGITVTSASKAFNLAGLKCAMIITQSEELRARIDTMPISVAFRASLFGAAAATAAFKSSQSWLAGALKRLDENRNLINRLIESRLPAIGYRVPDFGYLAWLDLSKLGLGEDPSRAILERGRLAINSGALYSPAHQRFARLNFGTSAELITEAFDRIQRSL